MDISAARQINNNVYFLVIATYCCVNAYISLLAWNPKLVCPSHNRSDLATKSNYLTKSKEDLCTHIQWVHCVGYYYCTRFNLARVRPN